MAKRVLVVDDEKLIVKGIRFSLEQDGMEVDCAYDGEEALEYARNTEYDIVILDLMLPKIDGLSVCQQIREFSDMPIIMLTAKGEDMDKIMGLEYGADDYITKPFNILEVKARIKAIIVEQNSRMRLSLTIYPIYILSMIGFSRFDAVWITSTPPMKTEITPTSRIDEMISLSASFMNCLQNMRHFSGFRKTIFRKRT